MVQNDADGPPEGIPCPHACGLHPVFEFRECLFDGVQIGAVWRQEQQVSFCSAGLASRTALLLSLPGLVHHHHISGPQGRDQNAFDIGSEVLPLMGPSNTQGASMRSWRNAAMKIEVFPGQAFALWCLAAQRNHVRLHPSFINEDQPCRIETLLMPLPPVPAALHIGAFVLISDQRLFLKLNPQPRRNRQTVSWLTSYHGLGKHLLQHH